jgi:arylsulfatase A-like enzyme
VFIGSVGDEVVPPWRELRTRRWAYVELGTGERELYDLRHDPDQLVNVVDEPSNASLVRRLSAGLAAYGAG